MKIDYKYYIANLVTGQILDELAFVEVTWSKKVKAAGQFQGTIVSNTQRPLFDIRTLTTPGNRALYVVRNGQVVWGGIVWEREYTQGEGKLSITALGFEVYLAHRVLWKKRSYDTVDIFNIVRDLLHGVLVDFNPSASVIAGTPSTYSPSSGYFGRPDHADIGLDAHLGAGGIGVNMTNDEDFRGNEMKYVGEILDALSDNRNFFEYRINSTYSSGLRLFVNNFVLYVPEANGANAAITFEYPGNVLSFHWMDGMEHAATRYWVTGAGDGPDKLIAHWTNEELLDQHQGEEDADYLQYPLYDEVESSKHGSTKSQDRLDGYAETYGRRARPPIVDWDVTVFGAKDPQVGTYLAGDWARFIIDDPGFGPKDAFTRRITEISVKVPDDEHANESVDLVLTNEAGPDTDLT